MARRGRSFVIREDGPTAVVRGWQVKEVLIDAGIKPMYSAIRKGWVIDSTRLPDLCAMCDYRSIRYRFEEVDDAQT